MRRNNKADKMEKRVSNIPIESVYTRHDIINGYDGYHFNHNAQWVSTFSNNKAIGLRRLEIFPTSHNFELEYTVYQQHPGPDIQYGEWSAPIVSRLVNKPLMWQVGSYVFDRPIFTETIPGESDNELVYSLDERGNAVCDINAYMYLIKYIFSEEEHENGSYKITMYYKRTLSKYTNKATLTRQTISITDANEIYEVLHVLFDVHVNEKVGGGYRKVEYDYNSATAKLRIQTFQMGCFEKGTFQVSTPLSNRNIIEFLRLLNQEITLDNYFKMLIPRYVYTFSNVWNRKCAVFHASFSNCKRNYIGMQKDFWPVPNKLYDYQDGSDFSIKFSTDGTHYFVPLYSDFIIELVYILNTENVEIQR